MGIPKRKIEHRYVITRDRRSGIVHVSSVLDKYPNVEIIDRLDESTILVAMTEYMSKRLSARYPELDIELNELYDLAD